MTARNQFDPVADIKKELSPIENDPRFLDLIKEYKCRQSHICLKRYLNFITLIFNNHFYR